MASGTFERMSKILTWQRSREKRYGVEEQQDKCPEVGSGYLWILLNAPTRQTLEKTHSSGQRIWNPGTPWQMEEADKNSEWRVANIQHSDPLHTVIRSEYQLNKMDLINHRGLERTMSAWIWHIKSFTGNHMRQSGRLLKPGSTAVLQEMGEDWSNTGTSTLLQELWGEAKLVYIIFKPQEAWLKCVI